MPRGRKPVPPELRLILNTHRTNRHGKLSEVQHQIDVQRSAFGPLEKPDDLSPEASACWDRVITPAFWLDGSMLGSAIIYCELWAENCLLRERFPASKIRIWRAFARDLGLSGPASRARHGA